MTLGRGHNDYSEAYGRDLFDKTPKTVFAAIAVSALTVGGDYLDEAAPRVLAEWANLYRAGIVSQRPPATAFVALADQDEHDDPARSFPMGTP